MFNYVVAIAVFNCALALFSIGPERDNGAPRQEVRHRPYVRHLFGRPNPSVRPSVPEPSAAQLEFLAGISLDNGRNALQLIYDEEAQAQLTSQLNDSAIEPEEESEGLSDDDENDDGRLE